MDSKATYAHRELGLEVRRSNSQDNVETDSETVSNELGDAFPQQLREFRERIGLSQSKLGNEAGFDHSYISRLESRGRRPALDAVQSLAKALRLSPEETDMLLWSAGFVGERPLSFKLARTEPELATVFQLLQSTSVPNELKERVRAHLDSMIRLIGKTAIEHVVALPE